MRPACTDRYILRRMPHVLTVFGTRPEAVKLAPVVLELQRRAGASLISQVCVTAQHREMLDQVLRVFGIVPDVDLDVMADNQSPTQVASAVLARLEPVLQELRPDWVVVQGDTTTVALAALAAFYARVRVAHVEAGLRTDDKWQPFPEEINRRIAGVIADLHLAPTAHARDNLLREGVASERILVTGNPGIDALHWVTRQPTPPDMRDRFAAWGLNDPPAAPGCCWSRRIDARTSASASNRSAWLCVTWHVAIGAVCALSIPSIATRTSGSRSTACSARSPGSRSCRRSTTCPTCT